MNKKNTGENDTEIFVRTKIDEAMQKGIHRDYISAIKILESLLITHAGITKYLGTNLILFYTII